MASLLRSQFIDHMILRGFSENTQRAYVSAIKNLVRFYNKPPEKISNPEIQKYVLFLIHEKKIEYSSVSTSFAILRFFFRDFLRRADVDFYLPPRKKQLKLPDILTISEIYRIFEVCKDIKHKVLFMLLFDAGLRPSEATRLKVSNIISERMLIRVVRAKGNKDRYAVLSKTMLEKLRCYWRTYRPQDWLFPKTKKPHEPISYRYLSQIFLEAKKKAGITKVGGAHLLRHCFATYMLEAGHDLDIVRRLLGHSSISSTARYLHLTRRRLDRVKTPLDVLAKQCTHFS